MHEPETKQYQCRHIFTDGHRCGSPCLRGEHLCYYHHTTRKPITNPQQRQSRRSAFDLHLPDSNDRSAIQLAIGQVLQRIAANQIDPRRAGLLLYGLQIASLNLPKPKREATPEIVEEITTDPELGPLAPPAEVGHATERKSTVALLIEKIMNEPRRQDDLPPRPAERIMQNGQQPVPTPEQITIPTIQATADNPHNMRRRTNNAIRRGPQTAKRQNREQQQVLRLRRRMTTKRQKQKPNQVVWVLRGRWWKNRLERSAGGGLQCDAL